MSVKYTKLPPEESETTLFDYSSAFQYKSTNPNDYKSAFTYNSSPSSRYDIALEVNRGKCTTSGIITDVGFCL